MLFIFLGQAVYFTCLYHQQMCRLSTGVNSKAFQKIPPFHIICMILFSLFFIWRCEVTFPFLLLCRFIWISALPPTQSCSFHCSSFLPRFLTCAQLQLSGLLRTVTSLRLHPQVSTASQLRVWRISCLRQGFHPPCVMLHPCFRRRNLRPISLFGQGPRRTIAPGHIQKKQPPMRRNHFKDLLVHRDSPKLMDLI